LIFIQIALFVYDVTRSRAYGDVTVKSGASLILNTKGGAEIKNNFEVEKGGVFEIVV